VTDSNGKPPDALTPAQMRAWQARPAPAKPAQPPRPATSEVRPDPTGAFGFVRALEGSEPVWASPAWQNYIDELEAEIERLKDAEAARDALAEEVQRLRDIVSTRAASNDEARALISPHSDIWDPSCPPLPASGSLADALAEPKKRAAVEKVHNDMVRRLRDTGEWVGDDRSPDQWCAIARTDSGRLVGWAWTRMTAEDVITDWRTALPGETLSVPWWGAIRARGAGAPGDASPGNRAKSGPDNG